MGISVIGADSEGNNFSVDVGASGNNVVIFDKEYAAGAYSITSQLADSTLDIYAVNADGTLAGYTNTKALSCSKGFSKLVIYGATTNDLLTFEFKTTFSPSQAGTLDSGAAPYVTNVSPSDLPDIDDTTTVTGGNFATDVEVSFTGTNDVALPAKNIVRSSSTSLIVTRPDALLQDHSPYDVTVTNPGIASPTSSNVNKLVDGMTAGGDPIWVTAAGALAGASGPYSTIIEATDPDGGLIVYSIVSGSLPNGLSLNSSTGEVDGTATTLGTFSFTVAATDSGGNTTNRSFSIASTLAAGGTVTSLPGYLVHTFTSTSNLEIFTTLSDLEYLVVAGGGGGGVGGGGAGGVLAGTLSSISAGTYNIQVGSGGSGGVSTTNGSDGGSSSIGSIVIATGGGGGGAQSSTGRTGGSGGGGGEGDQGGGAGINGQGNSGGAGSNANDHGGGGGGAGEAGNVDGLGFGGDGITSSIDGTSYIYGGGGSGFAYTNRNQIGGAGGGGGGGGSFVGSSGGDGGRSLGANGTTSNGGNGGAQTGGGGGGYSNSTGTGGTGGSGIVIIRYPI